MVIVFIEFACWVVAGIVLGEAIKIHRLNEQMEQDAQPIIMTNSVTSTYTLSDTFDAGTAEVTYGEISPVYNITNAPGRFLAISEPIGGGFTIQYGLDANSNAFCYPTNIMIPMDYVGFVNITQDTTSNAQLTLTINGPGGGTLLYNILTNQMNNDEIDFGYMASNGADSDGDTASWAPNTFSTNVVIIQRSTNLITWVSISTNEVNPGYVNFYRDTTIFWPTTTTFYSTNTANGGGALSPDGTNSVSTNGVISIPGQAYYRIEYPSNQSDYISLFSD